jgi:hypothetical protein
MIIHTYILDVDSAYDQIAQATISKCWFEDLSHPRLPLPTTRRGTEGLARGNGLSGVGSTTGAVQSVADNQSSPPVRHTVTRKLDTEEDDDGADGKTDIPSSRGDVVVLHPPTTVLVTDQFVESPTDQDPGKLP